MNRNLDHVNFQDLQNELIEWIFPVDRHISKNEDLSWFDKMAFEEKRVFLIRFFLKIFKNMKGTICPLSFKFV